jgi:hypothetical protein
MQRQRVFRIASTWSLVFAALAASDGVVACSSSTGSPTTAAPAPSGTTDSGGTPSSDLDGSVDSGVASQPDAASDDTGSEVDSATGGDVADIGTDSAPTDSGVSAEGATGAKHAVLVWGYGEHLATPKPTDPLEPLDVEMKALLEAKGLIVDLAEDAVSTVAGVTGKALMVISSSVNRLNLTDNGTQNGNPRFRDVPVPAIVMKDGVIEIMGLGTGSTGGFSTGLGQTQVTIIAPADPLAAGLMGNVTVYTTMGGAVCPMCYTGHVMNSDRIIYAFPAVSARKIATVVGSPTEMTIFAYAAGAMMANGVVAPAKRMGFFIHRDTQYSPDGEKLFNAAVDYLLAP